MRILLILILLAGIAQPVVANECEAPLQMLERGLNARETPDLPRATSLLEEGLICHPGDRNLTLELAMTLAWQQEFDAAIELYRTFLAGSPGDVAARLGLGRVLAWSGSRSDAAGLYDSLLAEDSTQVEALNGRGFVAEADWDLNMARRLYRAALSRDSANVEASTALERLSKTRRMDTRIHLGGLRISDGRRVVGNWASVSYRMTARSSLAASVSNSTRLSGDPVHEQRASIGLVRQMNPSLTAVAQVAASRSQSGIVAHVSLSASRRMSTRLTLLGSVQGSRSVLSGMSGLWSIGAMWSMGRRGHVMMQEYRFFGAAGFRSASMVAGVTLLVGRLSLAPSVTWYRGPGRRTLDYSVGAGVAVHSIRVGVQAGGTADSPRPKFGLSLAFR